MKLLFELQGTDLTRMYGHVRDETEALARRLSPEDQSVQSMECASPTRWHRAHTTWFFEAFVMEPHWKGFTPYNPAFAHLFNSYYNSKGPRRHPRHLRGILSRPSDAEVAEWRKRVDHNILQMLKDGAPPEVQRLVLLGLHHEQQHQELLLTDIKHAFSLNYLRPVFEARGNDTDTIPPLLNWIPIREGVHAVGHDGSTEFSYDNEQPRHNVYLQAAKIASRPSTNSEYADFIHSGGYRMPEYWLAEGWNMVQREELTAPLYWELRDHEWYTYTLAGMRRVVMAEPVVHLSFYEADAFARWSGARLPTEQEWETVAMDTGTWVASCAFHPRILGDDPQFFGDVWQWTSSAYAPYPGFKPWSGAAGEYNGKFMSNQMVLRGGSCATPRPHIRATYRNFFPPETRWQYSGVRLARDDDS